MKKGEIDLNSYFVQELKRAVFQKKMYLTIAIAFICIWIGAIEEVLFPLPNNAFNLFILSYHFSFLIVIFPLLACLPYATSYLEDCKTGHIQYALIRMTPAKYIFTKIMVNGLAGGLGILLGCILAFFTLVVVEGIELNTISIVPVDAIVFHKLLLTYPLLWMYVLFLVIFIGGFCFATFGLGLSVIIRNPYITILFPFFYEIFSGVVLTKISYVLFIAYALSLASGGASIELVIIHNSILLTVGLLFFVIGVKIHVKNLY